MAYINNDELESMVLQYQRDHKFTNQIYKQFNYILNQATRKMFFKDEELKNDCCAGAMESMYIALDKFSRIKVRNIVSVDFDNNKVIIETKKVKKQEDVCGDGGEEEDESETCCDADEPQLKEKEYIKVGYKIENVVMTDLQKKYWDNRDAKSFVETKTIDCVNNCFSYFTSVCTTGLAKTFREYFPKNRIATTSLNTILENSSNASSVDDYSGL